MFKEFLRSVDGIETYPTIALIIFFTTFVGVIIRSLTLDKQHVEDMLNLPFDSQPNSSKSGENNG
ncbi:MAG: CcoQ/FixQ family Cbb3-type cytochrome c oxidase assembly chaperone [SAR324 cluster bacterium]|uniref:CcoQ/FixQ family Cbb3-type cytochrome c oxidase assembly chaperone n=1 Tax=SAR324 cluster bacterium TaxID=2024889 RepID=A0A2A4TAR7_9DELT|nr:MAG: CcoQ/FixQ family Cbb3-type cytochrome c oxidase assembly chaperone [SAR324 cluster bacterium]